MDEASNSIVSMEEYSPVAAHTLLKSGPVNELWLSVRHGRKVVLKGLRKHLRSKPEYVALLHKEAELMMRLDHPTMVRIYGIEESALTGPCIVMEYIDGLTLGRWMADKRPSRSARRQIALELASSLRYLHSAGISHRDLKPDNILVCHAETNPTLRLLDFGLGDSDDFVLFKDSGATRSFGAPEQLDDRHQGDSRSDIYSFALLVRLLRPDRLLIWLTRSCLSEVPDRRPDINNIMRRYARLRRLRNALYAAGAAAVLLLALRIFIPPAGTSSSPLPQTSISQRVAQTSTPDTLSSSLPEPTASSSATAVSPVSEHVSAGSLPQTAPADPRPADAEEAARQIYLQYQHEAETMNARHHSLMLTTTADDDVAAQQAASETMTTELQQLYNDFAAALHKGGLQDERVYHYVHLLTQHRDADFMARMKGGEK